MSHRSLPSGHARHGSVEDVRTREIVLSEAVRREPGPSSLPCLDRASGRSRSGQATAYRGLAEAVVAFVDLEDDVQTPVGWSWFGQWSDNWSSSLTMKHSSRACDAGSGRLGLFSRRLDVELIEVIFALIEPKEVVMSQADLDELPAPVALLLVMAFPCFRCTISHSSLA